MRAFITLSLSAALFTACDLVQAPKDTAIDDTNAVLDDTDGSDDTEDSAVELADAKIRFLNVADGLVAKFSFAANATSPGLEQGTLYFTQGTAYADIDEGTYEVTLSKDGGGVVSTQTVTLTADEHYSVVAMRVVGDPTQAELVVIEDRTSADGDIAASTTRLNIIPARGFDGMYAGQVYYNWGSAEQTVHERCGYADAGTLEIAAGESEICDYPYAATSIYLFGQWGVPTNEPQVAQEIDNFIQVGNNQLVNVYLTCEGACTSDDHFILGHYEDGHTATNEGCQLYTVNSANELSISDC